MRRGGPGAKGKDASERNKGKEGTEHAVRKRGGRPKDRWKTSKMRQKTEYQSHIRRTGGKKLSEIKQN